MIDGTRDDYHDDQQTYRLRYDPTMNANLSTEIVRSVADATGDDPTSIEPLYYTIDPQLIDRFADRSPDGGALKFTFHGHDIEVGADGEVMFELTTD